MSIIYLNASICIFIVVKSFVEMAKFLLNQPGIEYILSEKFCQDPLEVFFGKQHAQGGCNDNPTSHQFLKNTVSLRIQATVATDPARGNCRKRPLHHNATEIDETPLPRRKRGKQ